MTKYKWSLLGLILSIILFIVFLISPLINFINEPKIIPIKPVPIEFLPIESFIEDNSIYKNKEYEISNAEKEMYYKEWYGNVPKKINRTAFSNFGKSFYHWNLFWIGVIVFSFMTFNYKKTNKYVTEIED